MATKKRKKSRTVRRRRIGAAGGMQGTIMKVAGIGAGVLIASEVKKMVTSLSPTILGAGEVVIGFMLPKFVKNNALIDGIADGLLAKGALDLMTSFGVIGGIGSLLPSPYPQAALTMSVPRGELASLGTLHSN